VREFVEKAFAVIGVTIQWEGEGLDEVGKNAATQKVLVRIDPRYFRPTEVDLLLGNPTKAKQVLGWATSISFDSLVQEMVQKDIELFKRGDINN
jgi:GDPmannose 4,6-dehydratase